MLGAFGRCEACSPARGVVRGGHGSVLSWVFVACGHMTVHGGDNKKNIMKRTMQILRVKGQ